MQPFVAARKAEIEAICRRFHVRRLDLFGSAARDDFDPARSDIDFLVEYEPDNPLGGLADRRLRNLLIHGYAVVEPARVWAIVEKELPGLKSVLDGLLGDAQLQGS
jgi:predicted nucleotidyltransferase